MAIPRRHPRTLSRYPDHVREFHASARRDGIALGLALRGPSMASADDTEREFVLARGLGLPISIDLLHSWTAAAQPPGAVPEWPPRR